MESQTTEQTKILNDLNQFTGTEQYHEHRILNRSLKITDGINYLRTELNCFWLLDIVLSIQHLNKIQDNTGFIIHRIKVDSETNKAIFKSYTDYNTDNTEEENDKQYLLYSQIIPYSDFKLNDFEFYQVGEVLLLKSEY